MIRKFYCLILLFLFLFFCGKNLHSISQITINDKLIPLDDKHIIIYYDSLYFSGTFLMKFMNLEVKELVKGEQLGICRNELCIPFILNRKEREAVSISKEYYFQVEILSRSLNWKYEWEKEENEIRLHTSYINY